MEQPIPKPETGRLSPDEIRAVYRAGEDAVVALVEALQDRIEQLERLFPIVHSLEARVKELEARLAQNSRNSHQPPSAHGLKKPAPPKSLRKKSGRKPGGQPGHVGRTHQPVEKPDHIILHRLDHCPCGQCGGRSLRKEPVLSHASRQVFELPEQALVVTEHQAEVKACPVSGKLVRAKFPAHASAPVQYGPRFVGLLDSRLHLHLPQAGPQPLGSLAAGGSGRALYAGNSRSEHIGNQNCSKTPE